MSLVLVTCRTIGFLITKETAMLRQPHILSSYSRLGEILFFFRLFGHTVIEIQRLLKVTETCETVIIVDYLSVINMCGAHASTRFFDSFSLVI